MATIYKLSSIDFGFSYNGQTYDFEHCDGMTIEDPRSSHITRGMNAKNKRGIKIDEALSDPDIITIPIMNVKKEVVDLLNKIQASDDERIEAYAIDRNTGQSRFIKEAIVSKKVRQLVISEGRDDLNIELILESFQVDDKLKEDAEVVG